jgi:hypothetical protein
LFGGDAGPLKLQPIDLLGVETEHALPLANPVLTPLELTEQLSSGGGTGDNSTGRLAAVDALSHPTLVATPDNRLLLFFAAHACGRDRWGIAAAESPDGSGLTWRGLGMVAEDEARDLHAPALFQHDGQVGRTWCMALYLWLALVAQQHRAPGTPAQQSQGFQSQSPLRIAPTLHWCQLPPRPPGLPPLTGPQWYLVPEAEGQQEVRLLAADRFPVSWRPAGTLLRQPLSGVRVAQHGGAWWLVGHRRSAGASEADRLAVFTARSPLGPWEEHPGGGGPHHAPTSAGSLLSWNDSLLRVGRSCRGGVCGGLAAVEMQAAGGGLQERRVPLDVGERLWRQRTAWDSAGWTHLAVARRPDGAWLAVVQGSQLPPEAPALSRQLQAAIAALRACALACILMLLLSAAVRLPPLRAALRRRRWGRLLLGCAGGSVPRKAGQAEGRADGATLLPTVFVQLLGAQAAHAKLTSRPRSTGSATQHQAGGGSAPTAGSGRAAARGGGALARLRRHLPPWRVALASLALVAALGGMSATRRVQRIAQPFFVPPHALPVGGQWSRFTLMVMSYDARLRQLRWYVSHYSRCPSVGECAACAFCCALGPHCAA